MSSNIRRLLALLAALLLVAAACSSDGEETTTADDASTEDAASTDEGASDDEAMEDDAMEDDAMEEKAAISVVSVSFSTNTVTVRNDGAAEVSLAGYSLCNRPTYVDAPEVSIAPGASAEIDVSALGLVPDSGEFGLYSSASFGSADAIVAYVQWGAADNGRASVAVEAGLIADGEFVDNGGEDFAL
ncbi:MAG: hypothetical protein AAF962_02875 [Actinomycetota bacterium]